MSLPLKHNSETKFLLENIPKSEISKWLLEQGYYPEQYVVPPVFQVKKFELQKKPYFNVTEKNGRQYFNVDKSDLVSISFPKTKFTDRTFGIIEPKIYHDLVWYLMEEWNLIFDLLFKKENKIYSYSFPIPISKDDDDEGVIGQLRAGRMIYEYIEMAENDLVAEAWKYEYVVKIDIKNFYPSIYTHSIAWAIHTKEVARENIGNFREFLGIKLDKLIQYANDGCTNGIAIGPAISDLISEIVLTSLDTESSKLLEVEKIDFIGVRFKDDYKFLCQSESDANTIIKIIQKQMNSFNLSISESKTGISKLPDGLFRGWTEEYVNVSLRENQSIKYKQFEFSLRATLEIDKKFEGTGVIDKFLSELTNDNNELKFDFHGKDLLKAISLMLLLKKNRNKSFPQILGIFEKIIKNTKDDKETLKKIVEIVKEIFNKKIKKIESNEYDLVWLIYFIKSLGLFKISSSQVVGSKLIKSLENNKLEFFQPLGVEMDLFEIIKSPGENIELAKYLALFKKPEDN
jgi:hypothetical protein